MANTRFTNVKVFTHLKNIYGLHPKHYNGLGISSFRMNSNSNTRKKLEIGVQGAGFGAGQTKKGVEQGPMFIRGSSFKDLIHEEVGHNLYDYGDIMFEQEIMKEEQPTLVEGGCVPLNNVSSVANGNYKIYKSAMKILQDNRIPLTLGGDHSISIGTINAVSEIYNGNLGVLWIDAHADLNTPFTTNSGNLHGFPVAFALKELEHEMKSLGSMFSWVKPKLEGKDVVYIGLREFGGKFNPRSQRENLAKLGILTFTMRDVDEVGIQKVIEMALEHLSPKGSWRPIHISFDVDALDDLEIGRCSGTWVSGGLTLREGIFLLEEAYKYNLVSADFVEVNPLLGNGREKERVQNVCKHLLGAMFGYRRGGL